MNVAIVGYPQSGKSTLYHAAARGLAKGDVTAVPVVDSRFDRVIALTEPKKATLANVLLYDYDEAVQPTGKAFPQRLLDQIRRAELLLHVVRAFESPMAPYHAEVDPLRDQEALEVEIVLTDLQIVESRLERMERTAEARKPGSQEYAERMFLQRAKPVLEHGNPLRTMDLSDAEEAVARGFQFLSVKPVVVAFNVSESEVSKPNERLKERVAKLSQRGVPAFIVCATFEAEVSRLDPADQEEFLASAGLDESASHSIIRTAYDAMDLITFFTAGGTEAKAWPLRRGSTALKAAATIHTDLAKGFIRAEVIHYSDFEASQTFQETKAKMHLEGKEYVVRDGDLITIRHKT